MQKKSIMIMATILVLTLGAGAAMAGWQGGCGMAGQHTPIPAPYNCPMMGAPGKYYCPRTGNGYCGMIAGPGRHTSAAATIDASGQHYIYPFSNYGGWGCR